MIHHGDNMDEVELNEDEIAEIREKALNLTHCPVCEQLKNKKVPVMWFRNKLECYECGFKMMDTQTDRDFEFGVM